MKTQMFVHNRRGSFGTYGVPGMSEKAASGYTQTACCLCGGKALYRCSSKGYCRDHKADAVQASCAKTEAILSASAVAWDGHADKGRKSELAQGRRFGGRKGKALLK